MHGKVRNDLVVDGDLSNLYTAVATVIIELYHGACVLDSTCQATMMNSGVFLILSNLPSVDYTVYETGRSGYKLTADSDGGKYNQIAVKLVAGVNSSGYTFLDALP